MNRKLEEQIQRMRELNDRLTQIRLDIQETNRLVALARVVKRRGPLLDVRDYRTFESHRYASHWSSTSSSCSPNPGRRKVRKRPRS
jgi:hypothetical protein